MSTPNFLPLIFKPKLKLHPPESLISSWDSEESYGNTTDILNEILKEIDGAKELICMEMFIFSLDNVGNKIIDHLKAAASRGVSVKLLVDGAGSPDFNDDIIEQLKKFELEAKIYKPFPVFFVKLRKLAFCFKWNNALQLIFQMNRRNHRKVILIDNKTALVGSANISDDYKDWRETMIRVTGDNVSQIKEGFDWVWNCTNKNNSFNKKPAFINDNVCNNLTWFNKRKVNQFKIKFLNQAKESIKITNPYFIPPYHLLVPLLRARRRGVDVSILTSSFTDIFFVKLFSRNYYKILIRYGVKIFERREKFIHSKIIIIDDKKAIVGTSNYNYRSVNWDLELDLMLAKENTIKKLKQDWDEDIKDSTLIIKSGGNSFFSRFLRWLNPLKKVS